MDDKGLEDAAILLMSLGEEHAAGVLRHLAPKQVQRLGETIARLKSVPRERIEEVLARFETVAQDPPVLVADTDEYVKNVLTKALGPDKAKLLIDRIVPRGDGHAGIDNLKWMDAGAVAELLRNEHPQIVAAILVHLDAEQASAVLKGFGERQRNEVAIRIATLDGIQPSALADLDEVLGRLLAGVKPRQASRGGAKAAAEIINQLGAPIETAVLDYIREADHDLAQKVLDNMFTFDDLVKLDDRGIQALLREVQTESLVVALKGASPELRERIFKNMSSRAAETLREDLDARGPVRLSEVEAEQKELMKTVRRLAEEGQIMLAAGGADGFV